MGLVHRHNLGPQGLTPALLLLPLQPCLPRPCPSPCFSVPRHLLQGTAVWELAHQFIRPLTCLLPAAPLSSQSAQDHCQTECQVVVWIGLERVGVCCVGPCPEISRSAATTILRGGAAGQNPAAIMAKPSRGLGDPSLPQPEHPEKGSVTGQPALLPCPAQSVL